MDFTASLQARSGSANAKFVFEEEDRPEWIGLRTEDMRDEERQMAEDAWAQNNALEVTRLKSEDSDKAYGLCRIHDYFTKHMKHTISALHDANLVVFGLFCHPELPCCGTSHPCTSWSVRTLEHTRDRTNRS